MKARFKITIALFAIGIATGWLITANAEETNKEKSNMTTHTTQTPALPIPDQYQEKHRATVQIDGEEAILTRYIRRDGRNTALGEEHFSTVYDQQGNLKGFARMEASLAQGSLPDVVESREIATTFLKRYAPDLLINSNEHFIEPHSETIQTMESGKTLTLIGMKVKMYNQNDKRWFWVIVGKDREVMVFERDIVWINFPGLRKTEKWLHDSWLKSQPGFNQAKPA